MSTLRTVAVTSALTSIAATGCGLATETGQTTSVSTSAVETNNGTESHRKHRTRVVYDETVDGDLSNDGLSPTKVKLWPGINLVRNTFNRGGEPDDPDYLTIVVRDGTKLVGIDLRSWEADPFEDIGFLGLQAGGAFTFVFPNQNPEPASGLLGWSHLRFAQVGGSSVLREMAVSNLPPAEVGLDDVFITEGNEGLIAQHAPGAAGFARFASPSDFSAELGPGMYTFWFRQGSGLNISTELAFEVVRDRRCRKRRSARKYREACDGDLSNDREDPTNIRMLRVGGTRLTATFNNCSEAPDPDYVTFRVPRGRKLVAVELLRWTASPVWEDIGFTGIVDGPVFDFTFPNPGNPDAPATGLLGWSHLRAAQVGGSGVLGEMAESNVDPASSGFDQVLIDEGNEALIDRWAPGAEGFDGSLGPGRYSMWLRQGSCTDITVDLRFVTKRACRGRRCGKYKN